MKLFKSILNVTKYFFYFLCIFVFMFFWFVYPRDSRVILPKIPYLNNNTRQFFEKVPFIPENFSITFSDSEPVDTSKFTNFFREKSSILNWPRLNYWSPGLYPVKLHGKKGWALKPGTSLTIKPSQENVIHLSRIDFSWFYLGQSPLKFSVNIHSHQHEQNLIYAPYLTTLMPLGESHAMRDLKLYFNPDPALHTWQNQHIEFEKSLQEITLTCNGDVKSDGFCVLSEPTFWQDIKTNSKPNILFILVDTMRFDSLTPEHAPLLNKNWKQDFHIYQNQISIGNMTTPSTNGILTGKPAHKIPKIAFTYFVDEPAKEKFYKLNEPSLGDTLAKNGWQTAAIGNISILSDVMGYGVNHGFEEQMVMEQNGFDTMQITREGLQWMEEHKSQPMALYLHYSSPHGPYKPPLADLWKNATLKSLLSRLEFFRWTYFATITFTDRYLDKVFSYLKEHELWDDTIIVLTADHGDMLTPHTFTNNNLGPTFTGSTIDHGSTLLQDEINVPLWIHLPDSLQKEPLAHEDLFTSGLDIFPTILDAVNIPKPTWLEGVALFESNESKIKNRIIPMASFYGRGIIINETLKYIRAYTPIHKLVTLPTGMLGSNKGLFIPEEVYNLENDPSESHNLVNLQPELLTKARKAFDEYYKITDVLKIKICNPPENLKIADPKAYWTKKIGPQQILYSDLTEEDIKNFKMTSSGNPIPLFATSLALSLDNFNMKNLPIESLMFTECLQNNSYGAVLKTRSDDDSGFTIESSNPELDKLLRQWGYVK